MWSTSSLSLLPDPLLPGVVVAVRVPCMGQIGQSENYLYPIGLSAKIPKMSNYTEIWILTYNEDDSLTTRYKITLDGLICH